MRGNRRDRGRTHRRAGSDGSQQQSPARRRCERASYGCIGGLGFPGAGSPLRCSPAGEQPPRAGDPDGAYRDYKERNRQTGTVRTRTLVAYELRVGDVVVDVPAGLADVVEQGAAYILYLTADAGRVMAAEPWTSAG